MTKHTEGPWRVAKPTGPGDQELPILRADGAQIGCVRMEGCRADARLIAAAPDLLEACKAAQSIVQQHNLQSTASEEDRLATLNRLSNWLNGPRLAAIRKAVDDDEWL